MTAEEVRRMNTSTLAYVGDAVYELMIRKMIVKKNPGNVDKAHKTAIKYVSAEGQATAARTMMNDGFLIDEEVSLLKRARNHRTMSKPSGADIRNYKIATGFEALLGYMYLADDNDRLEAVVLEAVRIIDDQEK